MTSAVAGLSLVTVRLCGVSRAWHSATSASRGPGLKGPGRTSRAGPLSRYFGCGTMRMYGLGDRQPSG
jgi:hypothetical protein